jgi:hypothetical protein
VLPNGNSPVINQDLWGSINSVYHSTLEVGDILYFLKGEIPMKRLRTLFVCLLVFLSACGTLEISVDRTATPDLRATATVRALEAQNAQLVTQNAALSATQPGTGPASASFQDGPFQFDLALYHDQVFSKTPEMAWQYSDISGTGTRISWVYHGPKVDGPSVVKWGTCESTLSSEIFPSLEEGTNSKRKGGIRLPEESRVGDREVFVYEIFNAQNSYGGLICFTLQESDSGFGLGKIMIEPLHSEQTDCHCGNE